MDAEKPLRGSRRLEPLHLTLSSPHDLMGVFGAIIFSEAFNIRLGAGAFVNFNCVILDVVEVTIGERTQIGPGVQILAADHPRDPALRASGLEFARPVRIGRNVWIGAGAIILPGVSIDDDALVGAGSVVTRDVPAGATAFGNPARVRS
ncbi:MAG TPA: sugar O-acetyltransferase [Vicinamibacterales bacterium]